MTTLIVTLCFSAGMILLLTVLLIRSYRDSDKRELRYLASLERQTDTMDRMVQHASTSTQRTAEELGTVVQMAIESSNKVTSEAIASTNQVTKEAISSTNQTMTDLFLGREREINEQYRGQESEETERQPLPGIETYEGLPSNMIEVLERERHETEHLTAPEWTVVSAPQPSGFDPRLLERWILDDDPVP